MKKAYSGSSLKKVTSICAGFVLLGLARETQAAVSIGAVNNASTGYWVSSTGTQLTSGGIAVGIFATTPDWSALKTLDAASAWAALVTAGFTDVRTFSGITQPSDWSFATGGSPTGIIGGTAGNIPFASLPANTRLYAIAFNAGSWNTTLNTMASATFGGTQWGAVSAFGHSITSENWLAPADLGSKSLQFKSSNLVANDVLVGALAPDYATTFNVQLIPEPSTGALLVMGSAIGFHLRRRKIAKS